MPLHKTLLLPFLQTLTLTAFSSPNDSLFFITDVKQFAFKEIGVEFSDFYIHWTKEEKPYIYLYVSQPDSVKKPTGFNQSYIFCGTDEANATKQETVYKDAGYHTFCYKTYANSSAMLNKRLLSYSKDAIAFIVFHELIHNYLGAKNIKIPYEYNEALCDVIGNYGTLAYAQYTKNIDLDSVKNQIKRNEKIYTYLNSTISKINSNPDKTSACNAKCQKSIYHNLKNANLFQKDRFDYTVNNAYLLKNEYYSKNYFLLKQVLMKQKSIPALLKIMESLPEKSEDYEAYLRRFT
ncbi:MAG: hypothetical protein ACKVQB_11235 [Bacteroidia bacterium]